MNLKVSPKEIFKMNLYLIFFLLCANIIGLISLEYTDSYFVKSLSHVFNFDTEANIPTLYSSIALVFASILLATIGVTYKNLKLSYIPWFGLSLIFLFLAIDETASIHEHLTLPTRDFLGTSELLFYAWVIPYGIALIVFIAAYSKFLFGLPKKTLILFLISGGIFISGAIGLELLGGREANLNGDGSAIYSFYYTCEEFLEMTGIAIFIYSLFTHIVEESESMKIEISKEPI